METTAELSFINIQLAKEKVIARQNVRWKLMDGLAAAMANYSSNSYSGAGLKAPTGPHLPEYWKYEVGRGTSPGRSGEVGSDQANAL